MNFKMKTKKDEMWYWAWIVEMTIANIDEGNPTAKAEVWENLFIIQARSPSEALRKANAIGESESGDCSGTLLLNGRSATTRFLGISDIGLIHDELADGSEILWRISKCRQKTAHSKVVPTRILLQRLKKEIGPKKGPEKGDRS